MENISILGGYTSPTAILVYLCFIALLLSPGFLFRGRTQLWVLFYLDLAVSLLFIMDLWNFRAFGNFISIHLIKQTANLQNLQDSIISMIRIYDCIFFADFAVFIFLLLKRRFSDSAAKRNLLAFAIFLVIPVLTIDLIHYRDDVWEKGQQQILFRVCWAPSQTIADLSPIGYHVYDAYLFWKESQPYVLTQQAKNEIKAWFDENKEVLPDNSYKGLFKGKNLIVIQVESLEGFVINQKVNNQEITPNLNQLLKNSLYFNDFCEQVHNGTSSDADLMTNTSVYPAREGSTFFRYPENTYNSLPKILQEMGYATTAIHPDKGSYWNWMEALTSIGFQRCIDSSYFQQDEIIGLGISDSSYLRQVEPVIKAENQPFYTFLVTLTSHAPFNLPAQYRELQLDPALDKTKLGGYFQSIRYTDKQLGIFLDKLQKDGILDNTVVAIYGDHEGVHKFYPDEISAIQPSESWWLSNNRQIPLIIYQNQFQGKVITTKGGQIDTLPTLCYLMGVDPAKYTGTAMGRNLLNTNKSFAVLDNIGYVGQNPDAEKKHAEAGMDIADKLLASNYFKSQP